MLFNGQRKAGERDQRISEEGSLSRPFSGLDAPISEGFRRIDAFLFKYLEYVDFKYCCYALLGNACSVLLSFVLWRITTIPPLLLQVLQQLTGLSLHLYVFMGYVKYSYLEDELRLRRIIEIVIGISLSGSLLLVLMPLLPVGKTKSTVFIALSVYLSAPLLFYGFRLVRTEEKKYFYVLSRLNLFTCLLGILWASLFIPWLASYPLMFLLMVISVGGFASIWFWELRLFYHLSQRWPGQTIPEA